MATVKVTMTGPRPWGFRIFGGADEPLIVAKIRKRSRAAEAGLHEGDVLLGVNGYSSRGLNHPTVMTLVEQSSSQLAFDVLRGASDRASVDAALDSLGSELQTLPADRHTTEAPAPTDEPAPYQSSTTTVNNQTSHITTKTTTEQLDGSTTLTKIQREEVFHGGKGPSLSPYPGQEQRGVSPQQMFQVPQVSSAPKPGVWQPSGAPQVKAFKVEAPAGVNIQHNTDQSVTMSFGLGGGNPPAAQPAWDNQENVAPVDVPQQYQPAPQPAPQQHQPPPPQFKVRKINPAGNQAWHAATPFAQHQPQPAPAHYEPPQVPVQARYEAPQQQAPLDFRNQHEGFDDVGDGSSEMMTEDEHELLKKVMYSRVVMEGGSESESGADSPTAWFRSKRKIYSDSAFYDDPEHKYPTIEEQIKMARKVALSLESPANRRARGHTMFIKRKQKADNWTTEFLGQAPQKPAMIMQDEEEEKYYNPNPWDHTHTWTPPSRSLSPAKPAVLPPSGGGWKPSLAAPPPPAPVPHVPFIPPAPALPAWGIQPKFSPKYTPSKSASDEHGTKPLNADEFERMRLHSQKSHHNTMPPSVAFSLAEDLRQMKGKGGRMFAKRQQRSEQWVVGEGESGVPNANVMNKILVQSAMEHSDPGRSGFVAHSRSPSAPAASGIDQPDYGASHTTGGVPRNRLKDMIEPPKPACTPWDAAAHEGTVEKAFQHLDGYLATSKGGYNKAISKNLEKAAERSYMTPYKPGAAGIPVNRKVASPTNKQWQLPSSDYSEVNGGFKNPTPPQSTAFATGGSAKTFRPVKFKAPSAGSTSRAVAFDTAPQPWQNPGGFNQEEAGISDL